MQKLDLDIMFFQIFSFKIHYRYIYIYIYTYYLINYSIKKMKHMT